MARPTNFNFSDFMSTTPGALWFVQAVPFASAVASAPGTPTATAQLMASDAQRFWGSVISVIRKDSSMSGD